MIENKKHPVWVIRSVYNPDELDWVLPIGEVKGFEKLGGNGGSKEILEWIDHVVDYALDNLSFMDKNDSEEIIKLSIEFYDKDQFNDIQLYDHDE